MRCGKLLSANGVKLNLSDMHDKKELARFSSIFNGAINSFENLSH